jgi:hypothetical protein
MKLIERIEKQLAKEGLQVRTNAARQWLLNKTKNLRPTPETIMKDRDRLKNTTIIGKMYHFFYDPKYKDSLPYYDRFPLVIPIERYPDGFLGMNLHYIHPKQRILLLDKLSDILTNDKYNEATRLKISYDYLSAATKIFQAKPCYKKYLFKHIESRFLEIGANEWDIAVMLPTENFVGAPKSKVFKESEDKF